MKFKIQSIILKKNKYTLADAKTILKDAGITLKKVDDTYRKNYHSFRLHNPSYLKKLGYTKYMTKKLSDGIDLIIVYKPTKFTKN